MKIVPFKFKVAQCTLIRVIRFPRDRRNVIVLKKKIITITRYDVRELKKETRIRFIRFIDRKKYIQEKSELPNRKGLLNLPSPPMRGKPIVFVVHRVVSVDKTHHRGHRTLHTRIDAPTRVLTL